MSCFNVSVSNSYAVVANFQSSYIKNKPKNDEIKKFLDVPYETIMQTGIPQYIHDYLRTILNCPVKSDDDFYETSAKALVQYLDQMRGSEIWGKKSEIILSSLASLITEFHLSTQVKIALNDQDGFDVLMFEGIKEKLIMLCAEGISRYNDPIGLEKGAWRVITIPILSMKNKILIYRCFEKNAWGYANISQTSGITTPSYFTRFPYSINILQDAITAKEKNVFTAFRNSMPAREPLKALFLADATETNQELQKGIYLTIGRSLSNSIFLDAAALFYAGPIDFSKNIPNGTDLEFLIDPSTKNVKLDHSKNDVDFENHNNNTNSPAQRAYQLSLEAVHALKEEAIEFLKKNPDEFEVSFSIMIPQSEKEWNNQEILLLTELSKDLDQNKPGAAKNILALASALDIEVPEEALSKEEKEQLDSKGSVDVSAKTVINVMRKSALKTYVQISKEEGEKKPLLPVESKQEAKASKTKTSLEQTISNKPKQKVKQNNNNKNNNNSVAPIKKTSIILSKNEKEMSTAVMKGNAQKASDFNKVARGMLEKILGKEADTIKEMKGGSHTVLHFEQNGIGKGLTLVKKHGNQDNVALVFRQKRTLKDLFELKDNA